MDEQLTTFAEQFFSHIAVNSIENKENRTKIEKIIFRRDS